MPASADVYGLLRPQVQIQDPLEQYGKMVSIRSLVGGEQLNELQRQKLARDLQEEEAVRQMFAGATPAQMSAPDFLQKVMGASPTRGIQLQQNLLQQQKTRGEIDKINAEVLAAKAKDARDTLAGVTDQASYEQWQKAGAEKGYQVALQSPPTYNKDWQRQHLATADQMLERLSPKLALPDTGGAIQPINPYTAQPAGQALAKTPAPQTHLVQDANGNYVAVQLPVPRAGGVPAQGGVAPAAAPDAGGAQAGVAPGAAAVGTQSAPGVMPIGIEGPASPGAAFRKGSAESMVAYEKGLNERVQQGSDLMMRVSEARDALKNFKPGGGAEQYKTLAETAQAAGLPQALVDKMAGGNLAAVQEFQKLSAQQAMEQLKQAMGGAGRISQYEFRVFQDNNPNISLDPRAIEKIYNFAERVFKRDRAEQQALTKYKKTPGADITEFPNYWQGQLENKGLTNAQAPTAATPKLFDSPPDPAKYAGRRLQADDGTVYQSNGRNWVRVAR